MVGTAHVRTCEASLCGYDILLIITFDSAIACLTNITLMAKRKASHQVQCTIMFLWSISGTPAILQDIFPLTLLKKRIYRYPSEHHR